MKVNLKWLLLINMLWTQTAQIAPATTISPPTEDIITGIIPEILLHIFEAGDLDASHCLGLTCKKMYKIGKKHRTILEENRVKEEGYGVLKPRLPPRFTFGIDDDELKPGWQVDDQLQGPFDKKSQLPALLKEWIGPNHVYDPDFMKTFVRKESFAIAKLGYMLAVTVSMVRLMDEEEIELRARQAADVSVGNELEE
ncbi:hypothetical protein M7I_1149 [Glarea lozoyensis 74030]|uniref:F-box domain-containing protein n=1 Tax=Glarea lozoyensis (strain ATCC 74030 / MF5533) TaxID=1104152 RepID=H0EFA7_GLAL7|nr:hypothetical protein M7I_1149 [Glarea lozoyensis 74030]